MARDNNVQKWTIFKEVLDNAVSKLVPFRKEDYTKTIMADKKHWTGHEVEAKSVEYL